jgi:hypothetical protein
MRPKKLAIMAVSWHAFSWHVPCHNDQLLCGFLLNIKALLNHLPKQVSHGRTISATEKLSISSPYTNFIPAVSLKSTALISGAGWGSTGNPIAPAHQ